MREAKNSLNHHILTRQSSLLHTKDDSVELSFIILVDRRIGSGVNPARWSGTKKMAEATSINSDEFSNFSFTPPRPRGRLRSFSRSHRSKYYAMTPNVSASKKFGSNTSLTSFGKYTGSNFLQLDIWFVLRCIYDIAKQYLFLPPHLPKKERKIAKEPELVHIFRTATKPVLIWHFDWLVILCEKLRADQTDLSCRTCTFIYRYYADEL